MRTLLLMCFVVATLKLHGQTNVFTETYGGTLPHRTKAPIVFGAILGNGPGGGLLLRLTGENVESSPQTVITFLVPAVQRRSGAIQANLPFGGKFLGHYKADRNVVVGTFYGFASKGRPEISRRRFEMSPFLPGPSSVFPGPPQ